MRNKRRVTALVVIATAAAIAAGGLMASNMGFKLNYNLAGPGDAVTRSDGGANFVGNCPVVDVIEGQIPRE